MIKYKPGGLHSIQVTNNVTKAKMHIDLLILDRFRSSQQEILVCYQALLKLSFYAMLRIVRL